MSAARRPRRIHIDTDPGLDDLLALALALGSAELAAPCVKEALATGDVSATRLGQFEPLLSEGVEVIES